MDNMVDANLTNNVESGNASLPNFNPPEMKEHSNPSTSPPAPTFVSPPGLSGSSDGWKAVGSPRRGSQSSQPPAPSSPTGIVSHLEQEKPESAPPRTRSTSNPNTHQSGGVDGQQLFAPSSASSPGGIADTSEKWASLGLQWNNRRPSVWGDSHADGITDSAGSQTNDSESPQRTCRSHSVAVGPSAELFSALTTRNKGDESSIEEPLNDEYDQIQLPKMRTRSRSISTYDSAISQIREVHGEEGDLVSIWNRVQTGETLVHRRSSTTPYSTLWEQASPSSPTGYSIPTDRLDRLRPQRRFSLSPNIHSSEYETINSGSPINRQAVPSNMSPRRHSVAGPLYNPPGRYLAEAFGGLRLEDREPRNNIPFGYGNLLEDVDDLQIEDHRNRNAYNEIGRGIPLNALPSNTKLYIVEFKAARSDVYYLADSNPSLVVKKGDLVIVEADRGKDLGKVINDAITPHQIHMLQAQQSDSAEIQRVAREIRPKRIYRLAQPQEVTMLVTKSQDEAKAMAVCQTKVRQKKLPMEVVDGEYQWDRRKLTFYFIADRRIDFRELVRDLFKIYKTRIWMCAVNPIPHPLKTLMDDSQQQLQQQ